MRMRLCFYESKIVKNSFSVRVVIQKSSETTEKEIATSFSNPLAARRCRSSWSCSWLTRFCNSIFLYFHPIEFFSLCLFNFFIFYNLSSFYTLPLSFYYLLSNNSYVPYHSSDSLTLSIPHLFSFTQAIFFFWFWKPSMRSKQSKIFAIRSTLLFRQSIFYFTHHNALLLRLMLCFEGNGSDGRAAWQRHTRTGNWTRLQESSLNLCSSCCFRFGRGWRQRIGHATGAFYDDDVFHGTVRLQSSS